MALYLAELVVEDIHGGEKKGSQRDVATENVFNKSAQPLRSRLSHWQNQYFMIQAEEPESRFMDINYLKRPQTISALEDSRGNEPIDSDVHASTFPVNCSLEPL